MKIRLPKCLSEVEKKGFLSYHETILKNFAPEESEVMSSNFFLLPGDRGIFCPFQEYSPWGPVLEFNFQVNPVHKALFNAVDKILTQTWGGCELGDMVLFYNRAYAIALHALNNSDSVFTLKSYLEIWDKTVDTRELEDRGLRFSHPNPSLCKYICAGMVYSILSHEVENRPEHLMQEIEWLMQTSHNGVKTDKLKIFREAMASICAPQEPAQFKSKVGRAKDFLFSEELTEELTTEFLQLLGNEGIASKAQDPGPRERQCIYKAMLTFVKKHKKSIVMESPASMCRFLTESCGVLKPTTKNGKFVNNSNFETEIRKLLFP